MSETAGPSPLNLIIFSVLFPSHISDNASLISFLLPSSSVCPSYVDVLSLAHFPSHPTWVVLSESCNWSHGFYSHRGYYRLVTLKSYSSPALTNIFRLHTHTCACISQRYQNPYSPGWLHHCLPVSQETASCCSPPVSYQYHHPHSYPSKKAGSHFLLFLFFIVISKLTTQTYLESVLFSLI